MDVDGRPSTLAQFTQWTEERYGPETALRFRAPGDGGWQTRTYGELGAEVRAVGRALLGMEVAAGERVAVLAETRPQWTYTHFGVLAAGAVLVPVYPTAGEEELAWVLADSEAVVVVCDDAAQAQRVEALWAELPALRAVVGMDALPSLPQAPEAELLARAAAVAPGADASIVYTSGTTGLPKGCRLTHGNLGAIQDATLPLIRGGPGDSTYLYLPLAHLLAQLIQFSTLLEGGELCYFGGRIEDVLAELAVVRPTHLPSVPRLFEKLHSVVLSLAEAQEGGRERLEEAVRLGVLAAEGRLPESRREECEAAEKSLYSLVRGAFGGRLKWALTGGAPIAPATLDLLRACGIAVYEGYGMTESGGVISSTTRTRCGTGRWGARSLAARCGSRRTGRCWRGGRWCSRATTRTRRQRRRRWTRRAGCTPATWANWTPRGTCGSPVARRRSSSPRRGRTSPRRRSSSPSSARATSPAR